MRFLDRGWQYTVYDLGNGRVYKRYNTLVEAYRVMLRDAFRHLRLPVLFFSYYYKKGRESAERSLTLVSESKLDKLLFGNPILRSRYEYEQECAESLARYLGRVSEAEGKKCIDAFVDFNRYLVQNSIIEKNFNIGDNFGRTASGNIILMDLGELCTSREEIERQIRDRVWVAQDIVSHLPPHLRTYFVQKMDETFG